MYMYVYICILCKQYSNELYSLQQQDGTYSNLILSLSTTIGTKFNCYEIILFLIAIVTVILGAVYGTKPFEFLRCVLCMCVCVYVHDYMYMCTVYMYCVCVCVCFLYMYMYMCM